MTMTTVGRWRPYIGIALIAAAALGAAVLGAAAVWDLAVSAWRGDAAAAVLLSVAGILLFGSTGAWLLRDDAQARRAPSPRKD